ncbi:MAG: hypothetical protein HZB16_22955 [Armatimonadetes bacterium]|nr:hypothetical protein [Armatimonadota bacterium]
MGWLTRMAGVLLVVAAAGAADSPRRISYVADQVPARQVIDELSARLNRRLYATWSEDPWLKKPLTLRFDRAFPRDVLAELSRVGERQLQRGDHWSYWLQQGNRGDRRLDERQLGDWLVRLRSVSYTYRADVQPGSAEPPHIERALSVEWLLLPPDDQAILGLVDAQPRPLRYSDGTTVAVGEQQLAMSINEGYLQLTLRLPEPPVGAGLRLAELGLALTTAPITERVVSLDLPAQGATGPMVTAEGWQYTVEHRDRRFVVAARPVDAVDGPRPPDVKRSPIANQLAELLAGRQRCAEARLQGADGTPMLTATSCEPAGGSRSPAAGLRIAAWPHGQEKPPEAARMVLCVVDRGQPAVAEELAWRDLPLPPRTLGDLP